MYIDLVIVEARNIKAADINGFSDPYVLLKKVKGVLSEAKTPTINKTLNPVWNYKATVKVDYNLHALIFELYDHDAVTKDDHLGSVLIKSSVFNDGIIVDTWEDIIGKDGKVYGQLHLQMEPHNLCTFCESNQTFSIVIMQIIKLVYLRSHLLSLIKSFILKANFHWAYVGT